MDATKPYKFIGFGAMDVTKPYEFLGFGPEVYPGSEFAQRPGHTRVRSGPRQPASWVP